MLTLICENCGKEFESPRRSKKYCSCACANKAAANSRANDFDEKETKIVWSSGGGIQSTAIAVLIWQGKLPKPDYSIMIDAGYESERTLDYIRRVVQPKLREVGVEFNLIPATDYVDVRIMEDNEHCNLPAFHKNADGTVSKFSTRCNGTWKQIVMKRWLRERGVEKCVDWVGISTDEARRANKTDKLKWITNRYPLIELNMSRTDCVKLIRDAGWEMPLRTSCVMCPLRTKYEWLKLKMDCPQDFERACEIERDIQRINPNIFLNPACVPLEVYVDGE